MKRIDILDDLCVPNLAQAAGGGLWRTVPQVMSPQRSDTAGADRNGPRDGRGMALPRSATCRAGGDRGPTCSGREPR